MADLLLDLYGLSDPVRAEIASVDASVNVVRSRRDAGDYRDLLAKAKIVVGWPSVEEMGHAPALGWLALPSAGADQYIGKVPPQVTLTCARGVFGVPIAEHVLAMMLALSIQLPQMWRNQLGKKWQQPPRSCELAGSTCLVVGMGDIGTQVARRTSAMGMRTLAIRRRVTSRPDFVERMGNLNDLDEMLPLADHVVLTLPGTSHTRNALSAGRIERMRKGAMIYNIGRGSAIDETAMIAALRSGHLAGAGLDVFEREPLPADSPLWEMPNVMITPHCSGRTPEHGKRFGELMARNFRRFIAGEALENVVDANWGY